MTGLEQHHSKRLPPHEKALHQQDSSKIKSSSHHHPNQHNFTIRQCQVQPTPWVCCSLYLQEWNKVVLFQVITARLGQEVHKFRSLIMTGLQSSGEEKREQMVERLLPFSSYAPSTLFIIHLVTPVLNSCFKNCKYRNNTF